MQDIYRNTWVEVNLDAIGHNVQQMKQLLSKKTRIIAVVKADGYGHGAVEVANRAIASGANALAVAIMEEALELRDAGITVPILVFGWVAPSDTPVAAENDLTLTCFQKDWIEQVKSYSFSRPLKVQMIWDTGMGRVGVRKESDLEDLTIELADATAIRLTGVYTHFATADEKEFTYFYEQQSRFQSLWQTFTKHWNKPVAVHTGNSAAAMRFPNEMYHFIRFGISMYGLYPSDTIKQEDIIPLRQAFSLHSRLIHVKEVEAGESISYGVTYTAASKEWIGTIPIGYADGWFRKLQGFEVLVDGKRMPIVGKVCMDQTMIRLDGCYPLGTKVTLIGKQQDEEIGMDELADYLDTVNYEIPCNITKRVPRFYVREDGDFSG